MNTRLVVAVISSIFEEALLAGAVLWLLPYYGIVIPLWVLIALMVLLAVNSVTFYIIGSRALRRKMLRGLPDMVGMCGCVTTALAPKGTVRIGSERWQARADGGDIAAGAEIEVVAQDGLLLKVVCRSREGVK